MIVDCLGCGHLFNIHEPGNVVAYHTHSCSSSEEEIDQLIAKLAEEELDRKGENGKA